MNQNEKLEYLTSLEISGHISMETTQAEQNIQSFTWIFTFVIKS